MPNTKLNPKPDSIYTSSLLRRLHFSAYLNVSIEENLTMVMASALTSPFDSKNFTPCRHRKLYL